MILSLILIILVTFAIGLVVGAILTSNELEKMAYEKAKRQWRRMEGL